MLCWHFTHIVIKSESLKKLNSKKKKNWIPAHTEPINHKNRTWWIFTNQSHLHHQSQIKKWSLTKHLEATLCSFPSHHHQTPSNGNNYLEAFFFWWACTWPALVSKLSLLKKIFIFGCTGSSLMLVGFLSLGWVGATRFFSTLLYVCVHVHSLSLIQLFATLWTVAHQAPLSMGFHQVLFLWLMVSLIALGTRAQ